MKKLLIFILTGLFLPVFCFGAISYERIPSDYTILSPVHFDISFDDISEICYGEPPNEPTGNWKVIIYDYEGLEPFISELFATPTTAVSFDMILPVGDYMIVDAYCEKATTPTHWDEDYEFEGDSGEWFVIFEIVETLPIFELPENAISSTTETITDLFDSIGAFIWLIIGIPLSFVVIKRIMLIIPK